ncbi:hybrid sensor histidine kinase/response regulator transcription factor [Echinicola sediminis]
MKLPLIALLLYLTLSPCLAQKDSIQSVFSDQDQLTFYLLDVESGLSHNYVNSIEQDSLGFIWVATLEGLNRYDGQHFTVYRKNNRQPELGPADNYVQHVRLDHSKQLLLSTSRGLSIYDPKKDMFRHIDQRFGLTQDNINQTTLGPNGLAVLGIYDGGVQTISAQQVVDTFGHHPDKPNSLSSAKISSVAFQGDSILWVGSFDKGLNKINYQDKTVQRLSEKKSLSQNINCLYTDEKGNLWIGSNEGVQIITTKADTLRIRGASHPRAGLSDENVLCFEKDPMGNIWIGTRNGGLNIVDPKSIFSKSTLKIKWFLPKNDGSSVFNRTVSSLKLSEDGNMWIGTSTGINFVNPKGDPIKLIKRNLSYRHTISHDRIGSLAEGKNGHIWIGTDGGGLDLYHPSTGMIQHFVHDIKDPASLSNNYIISLLQDSQDRVWAGTYQGGLNRLDPSTGKCRHYLQSSQEGGNDVRVIFEDQKGQIWVGTNRGGLYRYHPPIDNFDYVRQLGKIDIRDIAEDELGNLWLATYGSGIIRYNYLTGEQEVFDESTVFGFPTGIIFSLCLLDNGDILAGSRYEGLFRLDPVHKTIAIFSPENGLSNSTINSIAKDHNGKIWLGTFNGISFFDPETNQVGNLNAYSNIQQSEFNIGAALATRSGEIYFGGNKGINVFRPDDLKQKRKNYPLIFSDLRLMNQKVLVNSPDQGWTLKANLPYLRQLNLSYDQSLISLDYVALKYPRANDVTYAYKLEPYHDQWIETLHTGTANLSNIPPGDYTLKIRAQSSTSDIAENQMAIFIAPPFWQTWPAYVLYLLIIVGLVYAGLKYYSDRLKLKSSLLIEKKQRQLEHELNEERARFFTGFSHELKTPLTLIMAPIEDLLLEVKSTKHLKGLQLVQKNAKYLLEMINKLLEFRKTELDINRLQLKNHYIVKPIQQWMAQYQPLAEQRKIKLKGSFPQVDFVAAVDLEKLHIIINNLLSNALKYCNPNDQVTITVTPHIDQFEINIGDNGPGIAIEDQEHIFNWYYQSGANTRQKGTGIGLALTKRLVEDHQGNIKLISQPGSGCIFSITFPFQKIEDDEVADTALQEDQSMWSPELETQDQRSVKSNLDLSEDKEVVLLIDDNPQILAYLDNLLSDTYDLIHAQNGQEGLEKAIQFVPDLIISDVMMPEKNGIDLCGILKTRQATTHIPVILLSAKDSVESITSGFGQGADEYITKPFNGRILLSRISNLLQAKVRLREYYLGNNSSNESLTEGQKSAVLKEKDFLKQLEKHILDQITEQNTDVDTISQLMGMSRTSLFRKLKALTGQNINQHIRTVRINRAAYLIKEENLGVAQAAYEVGFSSTKYFRKIFKDQFGYLPSEMGKGSDTETQH